MPFQMNFTVPRKHVKIRKISTSNVNINVNSNSSVSENVSELSEPVILDEDDKSGKEEKVNQSLALWTKNKNDLKKEDYYHGNFVITLLSYMVLKITVKILKV